MNITEPKRDTAIFGPHQWWITLGGTDFFFSSKEDANTATRLAWTAEDMAKAELADHISKVLP